MIALIGAALPAEYLLVKLDVHGKHQGSAEALLRIFAGGIAHRVEPGAVRQKTGGPGGHSVDIAYRKKQACYAVFNQFGHSANACCDGGNLAGHGFKGGEAEGFERAGHDHEIGQGKKLVYAILLAEEMNSFIDFEVVRQPLRGGAIRTVADQDQLRWNFARHLREYLNHVDDAFDGTEIRQVDQDGFVGARQIWIALLREDLRRRKAYRHRN